MTITIGQTTRQRCIRRRYYRTIRRRGLARLDAWLLLTRLCMALSEPYGKSGQSARLVLPRRGYGGHADIRDWQQANGIGAVGQTIRFGQGYWVRRCVTCEAPIYYPTHAEYIAGEQATACRSCEVRSSSTGATWPTDQHTVKVTGRKPTSRLVIRRGIAGVTGSLKYQTDGSAPWPDFDPVLRDSIADLLASTKVRADGTRRTLDVARVIGQVHDMVGLGQPVGAESVTWSQVKRVPDIIGLSTARHRCGLSGYFDPMVPIWHVDNADKLKRSGGPLAGIWTDRHGNVIGIERTDMFDSPDGHHWTFDPNTLDSLSAPMVIRPMASPLAPFTGNKRGKTASERATPGELEIGRGLRIKLARPTLRDSEKPEPLTWLANSERWTVHYLKGDQHPTGGYWLGHAVIGTRSAHAGSQAMTDALALRHTVNGERITNVKTRNRTIGTVTVPDTEDARRQAVLSVIAESVTPGDRVECVARRYSGALTCSPAGRYSFIGSDLDGNLIKVAGQRSPDALASRLALLTST